MADCSQLVPEIKGQVELVQLCGGADRDDQNDGDTIHNEGGHTFKESDSRENPDGLPLPREEVSAYVPDTCSDTLMDMHQMLVDPDKDAMLATKDRETSKLKADREAMQVKLETMEASLNASEKRNLKLSKMAKVNRKENRNLLKTIHTLTDTNKKHTETIQTLENEKEKYRRLYEKLVITLHQHATDITLSAQKASIEATYDPSELSAQAQGDQNEQVDCQIGAEIVVLSAENIGVDPNLVSQIALGPGGDLHTWNVFIGPEASDELPFLSTVPHSPTGNGVDIFGGNGSENTSNSSFPGQFPENPAPTNSDGENTEGPPCLSDTVEENQEEQDSVHKESTVKVKIAKRERADTWNLEKDINSGENKRMKNSVTEEFIPLSGDAQNPREIVPVPGAKPVGACLQKPKRAGRKTKDGKRFYWPRRSALLIQTVLKVLKEGEEELKQTAYLKKAWERCGNKFPAGESLRNHWDALVKKFLPKDGQRDQNVALIKGNLVKCLPVILDIVQKKTDSRDLIKVLEEIRRVEEGA